jgi:predicted nucleic acid-binding protein
MRYVLDTNACIYARKLLGGVAERMHKHLPTEFAITTITLAELWFGARRRACDNRASRTLFHQFRDDVRVKQVPEDAATT